MNIQYLHIHTLYSKDVKDNSLSIENIVQRAKGKQIDPVGFADHYHPGFNAPTIEEIGQAKSFVHSYQSSLQIYLGIEASILDQSGRITLNEKDKTLFDYVIASLHPNFPGVAKVPAANVRTFIDFLQRLYMNAAANPLVDVIGHPWNLHSKYGPGAAGKRGRGSGGGGDKSFPGQESPGGG